MPEWCVTFGSRHSNPPGLLMRSFWRVSAETELDARTLTIQQFGREWAFIYAADEFQSQIDEYGLTEVTF